MIEKQWKRDARYHGRGEVCCTIELAYQSEEHRAERRRQRVSSLAEDEARITDTSSDETRLVHSPLGHRTGTDLHRLVAAVSARMFKSGLTTYAVFN